MDARDVLIDATKARGLPNPEWEADAIINRLSLAGFSVIHDSENHGPTLERAAQMAETCPDTTFRESRRWHGDLRYSIPTAIRAMGEKK